MLIKNVFLFEGNEKVVRDILIRDEKIAEISENIDEAQEKVIDGSGKYLLPGIIDPHVHLRDPGLTYKEDFETGSMAAAKGGVTLFFDMPNTIPNTITEKDFLEKQEIIKGKSYVDYKFYFGGSKLDNSQEVLKVQDKAVATKVFMNVSTGNMLIEEETTLENVFKASRLVAVHAEGEMVGKAIELSKKIGVPVYLCHLSTKEEVEALRKAKKEGVKVYGEVTPHHLFLNEESITEENKMLLRMKPELKTKEDNEALWEALKDGTIDTIGTDHAPHTLAEKMEKITFGIPGVENSLEMMLKAVGNGKITAERLIEVMSSNAANIFEIENKGRIQVGYDADLVLVDLKKSQIIKREEVISKCGWTPYEGMETGGEIVTTIVRGNVVYNNKEFNKNKIGKEVM